MMYVIIVLGIFMIGLSIYDLVVKIKNNDPELDDFFDSP